jgi:CheY-like chemotaxis protein
MGVPLTAVPRVLVVEDELDARDALSALLQDSGFSVVAVGNGQEALSCLQNSSAAGVGIIILDLMMPVMDGSEFLE